MECRDIARPDVSHSLPASPLSMLIRPPYSILAAILMALIAAFPAHARDAELCQEICTTDHRQCLKDAAAQERQESSEPFLRQSLAATPSDFATETEARNARKAEASRRMFERKGQCDGVRMRCVADCRPGR